MSTRRTKSYKIHPKTDASRRHIGNPFPDRRFILKYSRTTRKLHVSCEGTNFLILSEGDKAYCYREARGGSAAMILHATQTVNGPGFFVVGVKPEKVEFRGRTLTDVEQGGGYLYIIPDDEPQFVDHILVNYGQTPALRAEIEYIRHSMEERARELGLSHFAATLRAALQTNLENNSTRTRENVDISVLGFDEAPRQSATTEDNDEESEAPSDQLCVICMAHRPNIQQFPCTHTVCCKKCFDRCEKKQCVICRCHVSCFNVVEKK